MANGDITNLAIAANGAQVTFDVAGMVAAGVSGFQSGKTATLACTSEAYSGTTLGTAARTGIKTSFRSAVAKGVTTVSDTFTEAGTTSLDAHTPDVDVSGLGWTEVAGDWQVNASDYAQLAANNGNSKAVIECGYPDGTLTCSIRVSAGFTNGKLIFRYVDTNNHWFVQLSDSADELRLYKRVAGVDTQVGTTQSITVATSTFYVIQVVLLDEAIDIKLSGSSLITEVNQADHKTATKCGLMGSNTTQFYDTFSFVAATGTTITLDLNEPIANDDTAVTMTMDADAFSDGTVTSDALAAESVSNASNVNDYPFAVCGIANVTLDERKTAPFYVEVYAAAGCYNGHRSQLGISAVSVTITDSAATARTLTATAMTKTTRIGDVGWQAEYALFRVGPFDPSDWNGSGTDAAAGLASIVATAYPKIGDAGSLRTSNTEYCYLDPTDAYDVQTAYVSTAGNDGTGVVNAQGTPFATMHKAIKACQTASSNSRASWSTIYLEEGSHTLGTYSFGDASNTSDGPVIITRAAGAAKAATIITGSATSDGLRTVAIMLDDLTIDTAGTGNISTGVAAVGTGALASLGNIIILRNCDMDGGSRTTGTGTWFSGFEVSYAVGCHWHDAFNGPFVTRLIRDCKCSEIAQDFASVPFVAVNNDIELDATGTVAHADVLQFADAATATNVAFHNNRVRGGGNFQGAPFGNWATSGGVTSFAMTFNVQEEDGGSESSQLIDPALQSIFFYHNVWGDGFLYRDNRDGFSARNMFVQRNYFGALSGNGSPNTAGIAHDNNHNSGGDVLTGSDWTTGGSNATQFDDFAAGDYYPAADGDLVDRWSDPIAPYDAYGQAMPEDGTGAIGAIQLLVDSTAPETSSFNLTETTLSFVSDEQLADITATLSGATTDSLVFADFTESGSGPYTYTATVSLNNGTTVATLTLAEDAAGNDGVEDPAQTDSYTKGSLNPVWPIGVWSGDVWTGHVFSEENNLPVQNAPTITATWFETLYTAVPAIPLGTGADITYSGGTMAVAEGGAGWCNGVQVAQAHLGGWSAHLAAYPTGLDVGIDETELDTYLDYVVSENVSDHFFSNFYEDLLYGENRGFHIAELVKVLSAAQAHDLYVHHYGFPHWNGTDEEDDYAWAEIGEHLDSVNIVLYAGYPGGSIQPFEWARFEELVRKAQRLQGDRPIIAWVNAYTHGGDQVETAKNEELLAWVKTKPIDAVMLWSDKGDTAANAAMAALFQPAP